jgi:hypothetical protein
VKIRHSVTALALGLLACEPETCPEAWADDAATRCLPPESVSDSAESSLGTGIYGFALGCYARDDEDTCECEVDGLHQGGSFTLVALDAAGNRTTDMVHVGVAEDATFEVELPVGSSWAFGFDTLEQGTTAGGTVVRSFTLAEGDVLYLEVVAVVSC